MLDKNEGKRRMLLLALGLFIVILGLFAALWWYFTMRNVVSTDDAYVVGNQVNISSQEAGSVVSISYIDTDLVREGDVLVTLDNTDVNISLNEAIHNLASTVRATKQYYINDLLYKSKINSAEIALKQSQNDYLRVMKLHGAAAISREDLEHAQNLVETSKSELQTAIQTYNSNHIIIKDTPLEKQPAILQSAEKVKQAWIMLQRTKIKSPVTGYVAQRNVQVGETISEGQSLMSVVPAQQFWINANFKETQLEGVSIGQKVKVITDLYGDNVVFNGTVEGINMGTGSAFSLLPAQNATGNWIKVVQRVPVKIKLESKEVELHPLRIGLSTTVTIHKTNLNEPVLAYRQENIPAYKSEALRIDTSSIDREIESIIQENKK